MAHSNQIREFRLTKSRYRAARCLCRCGWCPDRLGAIVAGGKDEAEELLRQQEIGRNQFGLERKREAMKLRFLCSGLNSKPKNRIALKAIGIEKARIQRISKDRAKNGQEPEKVMVSVTKSARTKG